LGRDIEKKKLFLIGNGEEGTGRLIWMEEFKTEGSEKGLRTASARKPSKTGGQKGKFPQKKER